MSHLGLTPHQSDTVIFCMFLLILLMFVTLVGMRAKRDDRVRASMHDLEEAIELAWAQGARREDIHRVIDEIYNKDKAIEKKIEAEDEDSIY